LRKFRSAVWEGFHDRGRGQRCPVGSKEASANKWVLRAPERRKSYATDVDGAFAWYDAHQTGATPVRSRDGGTLRGWFVQLSESRQRRKRTFLDIAQGVVYSDPARQHDPLRVIEARKTRGLLVKHDHVQKPLSHFFGIML
jgi:hypothetical protein